MTPPTEDRHFDHYQVRPRFEVQTSESAASIIDKIRHGLAQPNADCVGQVNLTFVSLEIPEKDRHYWSPRLHLSLEENTDGCLVRGLYGPRPTVWTLFVFFYALIGFAALCAGIIGYSNWSLGKSAGILWLVPVLVLLFFTFYLVAFLGQRWSYDQMQQLHAFMIRYTGLDI